MRVLITSSIFKQDSFGTAARRLWPVLSLRRFLPADLWNKRRFQETERNLERIRALHEIELAIASTMSLPSQLDVLLEKIEVFIPIAAATTVRLLNRKTGALESLACRGLSNEKWKAQERRAPTGRAKIIVKTKAPLTVPNVQTDPRTHDRELFRERGLVSYLGVPLITRDEVIGVLGLYTRDAHGFTDEEIEFLNTLAGQAAVAIDNARLYEQTERQLKRIEAVAEIDRAIASALSLKDVLDVLLKKIELFCPYAITGGVRLFDASTAKMVPLASLNIPLDEWRREIKTAKGRLTKELIETKKPLVIPDMRKDSRTSLRNFARRYHLVSYLGVPLIVKEEFIGTLIIYTKEKHEFNPEEVEFLATLASQAAIAIHNARLYEETERRRREAEELARVARSLTETLDTKAVGDRIVTSVRDLFGVKGSTLRVLESDGSFRHLASAGHTFSQSLGGEVLPPATGVTSRALAERRPVWSADILKDPEISLSDQMRDYQLRSGNGAMIAAPLYAHEKLTGALTLFDQTGRIYSDGEVALLQTFAHQAALALENAQLYKQTERQLNRIEALREIDKAITSTLDVQAVLNLLLEKIDVFLPFSAATTIRLFNRAKGKFENTACRNVEDEELWKTHVGRGTGNLSQEVLKTKQPVIVHDIRTDTQRKAGEFYRRHGFVSYLGVPLIAKDEILGILGFYTKTAYEFTQEETDFLLTVADQAAIAIHNSQLYEEIGQSKIELEQTTRYLERSLRQLGGLYAALAPITTAASTQEMMSGIIDRLIDATGADACLIRLRHAETDQYRIVSQRGFSDYYLTNAASIPSTTVVNWVIAHGQPLIVPDIAAEPRLKSKIQLQLGLRSCAMLPLRVGKEVRGFMHVASRKLGYFDEEQKNHLLAIARQMGIALENRELFYDLKFSRDELERANKGKDEFLSVISHELRTPLNVIKGYTEIITNRVLGAINPEQELALGKIMHQSRELLSMINSVLEVTRIGAKAVQAEWHEVNLGNFLNELRSNYDFPLEKELTLNWDYPTDLPVIKTDDEKLKQILQNLINNAIKFSDKGTVTISARPSSVAEVVEFKIADTGIGIPNDKIADIFDMFRQVDSSVTRSYGGAGIGLYIVKKFTELLEGNIEVESEPGKGSTFTIVLPHKYRI
jgi:GAF domain-containing protein